MAIRAPAKTPCTHTSHTPHGYTRTCKNTLHTHTHTHITHTTWLYAHLQKHPAHTHTSYTTWLYTHLQKHPAHTHTHHTHHMAIRAPAKTPCTHTHTSYTTWLYTHLEMHPEWHAGRFHPDHHFDSAVGICCVRLLRPSDVQYAGQASCTVLQRHVPV